MAAILARPVDILVNAKAVDRQLAIYSRKKQGRTCQRGRLRYTVQPAMIGR